MPRYAGWMMIAAAAATSGGVAAAEPVTVTCAVGTTLVHQPAGDQSDPWLLIYGDLDGCMKGTMLDGEAVFSKGGAVIGRGRFKEGKRVGHWERRFESGGVASEIEYVNGVAEGVFRELVRGGGPSETGAYRAGVKVGVWTYYLGGEPTNRIDYNKLHAAAVTCEPGTAAHVERLPGAGGTEGQWCAKPNGDKHGAFGTWNAVEDQLEISEHYRDGKRID